MPIQPLGSNQPLPDLPTTLTFNSYDANLAREEWNAFYRLYDDLLAASVLDFGVSGDAFRAHWVAIGNGIKTQSVTVT